jgi:hypothetical protein
MSDPNDSDQIYGLTVNMVKEVYDRNNWTEGVEYYYQCISFPDGLTELFENKEIFLIVPIGVSSVRMSLGVQFAQVFF